MTSEIKDKTTKFLQLNVNEHAETKDGLTYLSWAWAWQEVLKECPEATYKIKTFTNQITGVTLPYIEDNDGIMVFTEITVFGITREMWLPVLDSKNRPMKRFSYTYKTKSGEKYVDQVSMHDINRAIMRCLTKNIAMFGIGLYLYAGEDLPFDIDEPCTEKQIEKIRELGVNEKNACYRFKVGKIEDITYKEAEFVISSKMKELEKNNGKN